MPCHGCFSNFTIFIREHSCPKCRFSFCSRCVKQTFTFDEEGVKVCGSCSARGKGEAKTMSLHDFDPPSYLMKSIKNLDNQEKPPITIITNKGYMTNPKLGMNPRDMRIYERLEKLRQDRGADDLPSELEIERRLLLLKGESEDHEWPHHVQYVSKSEQEEVDELINRFVDENRLEQREKPMSDDPMLDQGTLLEQVLGMENTDTGEIDLDSSSSDKETGYEEDETMEK